MPRLTDDEKREIARAFGVWSEMYGSKLRDPFGSAVYACGQGQAVFVTCITSHGENLRKTPSEITFHDGSEVEERSGWSICVDRNSHPTYVPRKLERKFYNVVGATFVAVCHGTIPERVFLYPYHPHFSVGLIIDVLHAEQNKILAYNRFVRPHLP